MCRAGRAFVTGTSRGIGRSVALKLASEGYEIVGCYPTASERSQATEAEIRALGVRCMFAECDVRDGDAVERFVDAADREMGPITALVNNAGIVRDKPLVLMSREDWQAVLDTNLTGTWNVCHSVVYRFLKRRAGVVVNMS